MKNSVDNEAIYWPPALVVGASGRMAASMLTRLGIDCSVADLYGDADTKEICDGRVHQLSSLNDLRVCEALVREHRFVLFAGGLEGNLDVAAKLTSWSKPAFSSIESVRRINSASAFNVALQEAGLDRYPMLDQKTKVSFPAIVKDIAHSATAQLVHSEDDISLHAPSNTVLQKFIPGESVSLIYVADNGNVECLGGTFQLTECLKWTGSVAGLTLSQRNFQSALDFAIALVDQSEFIGVFGIDFIVDEHGIWPVDVNPRIPASSEIVGDAVMSRHLKAFGIECRRAAKSLEESISGKVVVFNRLKKPILFASESIGEFPVRHFASDHVVSVADLPHSGETIEVGQPILTVFTSGKTQVDVQAKLSQLASEILCRLGS